MHFYLFLRSLISCLVFSAFIKTTLSQFVPRVRPVLKSPIIYPVGATVHLECPVENDGNDLLFFEWSHDRNGPMEETHRIRINDRGVLKIKSATVEDSGTYFCKAINGFGSVITSTELKVEKDLSRLTSSQDNQYPIQFPQNDNTLSESGINSDFSYDVANTRQTMIRYSKPQVIRKMVGISVVLSCSVKSKARWTKNGRPLRIKQLPYGSFKKKGILTLSKVRLEDSGNYSCIGKDGSGQVNDTFTLIVYDNTLKPELTGFHPINTSVVLGERAVFHCKVHSEFKPIIQWLKSHDDIKDPNEAKRLGLIQINSVFYKVLKPQKVIDDGKGYYLNNLVIESSKFSDSANYICLAAYTHSGSFNYTFKSTYLKVLPKPTDETKDSSGFEFSMTNMFWLSCSVFTLIAIILIIIMYRMQRNPENPISNQSNPTNNNNNVNVEIEGNISDKNYNNYYRHDLTHSTFLSTVRDNSSSDRLTYAML